MFKVPYCGYNIRNDDYDTIDRPNGSQEYLFLYFMSPMLMELDGEKIHVPENTMILYAPGKRQWYRAKKIFYNSYIHFTDPDSFVERLELPVNTLFRISAPSELNEEIRHIEYEFHRADPFRLENISARVQLFLITLSRLYHAECGSSQMEQSLLTRFFNLRIYILAHLDVDWTTESMAELAHMSKSQFYYYYNLLFHQPPKAELIKARMEHAKYLLTNEALHVNQVARMIGYSNEYHFIRSFKKYYGITPKQYARHPETISVT